MAIFVEFTCTGYKLIKNGNLSSIFSEKVTVKQKYILGNGTSLAHKMKPTKTVIFSVDFLWVHMYIKVHDENEKYLP